MILNKVSGRFSGWVVTASIGLVASLCGGIHSANGEVIATGFFSGTLERFDPDTLAQTTFASIASASDPFPGLSGIALNNQTRQLYVSARISQRIYTVDADTGSTLGFHQLSTTPAGLAVDSNGQVFVSDNGGSSISVFDSNWNQVNTITVPDIGVGNNQPSGLAFDSNGRLLISTFAGAGIFQFDPNTSIVSSLAPSPLANGMIAFDSNDNFVVGGAAFSNDLLRFDENGVGLSNPYLTIDAALLPLPSGTFASPDFTSPAGVAYDENGNLFVAALGRTNPTSAADNFQSNGGLFKFDSSGSLVAQTGSTVTPLSSVIFVPSAVPEPSSVAMLTLCVAGVAIRRRKRY
ncbi:NHL repeat protein [Planctomycetes bacterium CA13]|uniref:NHL repeat protein n=2 Tax=Novipirellula herctigrandis TaxID=2527986 RepID=A0A5C5YZC9_9BACT|nr:NHL repeat protein [Planctomycetes bacterium CA13]